MGSLASSYTNFDDLLAGVVSGVQGVLEEVAPQIETRLQASAAKNVNSQSGRSEGIASSSNIVSSVVTEGNVVMMTVKDIALPEKPWIGEWSAFDFGKNEATGGTMFANWIEHGLWMDIAEWNRMGHPKDSKPKRPKREFVSPVQVEAAMIVKTALHGL